MNIFEMGVLQFVASIWNSRWFVIVAGIFLCCVSSCVYDFSVYSQSLKSNLDYTQNDLELVATSKDLGAALVIISAVLCELQPPWVVVSFGALEALTGYLMLWLSVSNKLGKPPVWQMCVYIGIAANSSMTLVLVSMVTCLKNFPSRRGTVSAALKGSFGIGAAFLIQIYETIYGTSDSTSFLLLLSWLVPSVALTFLFTLRPISAAGDDAQEQKYFIMFLLLIAALAVELLIVTLLENFVDLGRFWQRVSTLISCGSLLLSVCVVVIAELQTTETDCLWVESKGRTSTTRVDNVNAEQKTPLLEKSGQNIPELSSSSNTHNIVVGNASPGKPMPQRGDSFTLLQALKSLDFWLLFIAFGSGIGAATTLSNNMSQIGSSLGYTDTEITTLVSLWTIWGFTGMAAAGYASDWCLKKMGIARPIVMAAALAIGMVGHVMVAIAAFPGSLFVGSMLAAMCWGAQTSVYPATTSDLLGLKHVGNIMSIAYLGIPLVTYVLSVKVAGYLYDREAEEDTGLCIGRGCFGLTLLITSGVNLVGCLLSLLLAFRTRHFYKRYSLG